MEARSEVRIHPAGRRPVLTTSNGEAVPIEAIPRTSWAEFLVAVTGSLGAGSRLSALVKLPPEVGGGRGQIMAVLAADAAGCLDLVRMDVPDSRSYPALSTRYPQAQAFERELFEEHGIHPLGHPWLKPLRAHGSVTYETFHVEGSGVHEVAVGPVHAGIIEPGHFRFQCDGEKVLHLEIRLGYQHRGIEKQFLRPSPYRRVLVAESIAGDSVLAHGLAHCAAVEALAGVEVGLSVHTVRGVALEIERIANHVGDLGALCGDIGYQPGAASFGRLRGEFLNLLMDLSGNRHGRGILDAGGLRQTLTPAQCLRWLQALQHLERDLTQTSDIVFGNSSVADRFEHTGRLSFEASNELGLVGPVARACGSDRDVRRDHSFGIFRYSHLPVALAETGDVMARAIVRWLEVVRSIAFVKDRLSTLDGESKQAAAPEFPALEPGRLAVSMVEGWRGEVVHVAATSPKGDLAVYKVVDPSFHNWFGLAQAMRGNQISDFPLCNKSFNLSYAGHDL